MIDKKKFKNAINKSQKAMQNAPTDQSMTVDVKNEELEAQIKVYTKEKTSLLRLPANADFWYRQI